MISHVVSVSDTESPIKEETVRNTQVETGSAGETYLAWMPVCSREATVAVTSRR